MTLLIKHLNLGNWRRSGEENADKCREHSKKHKEASNAFKLIIQKLNQGDNHRCSHLESQVRGVPYARRPRWGRGPWGWGRGWPAQGHWSQEPLCHWRPASEAPAAGSLSLTESERIRRWEKLVLAQLFVKLKFQVLCSLSEKSNEHS